MIKKSAVDYFYTKNKYPSSESLTSTTCRIKYSDFIDKDKWEIYCKLFLINNNVNKIRTKIIDSWLISNIENYNISDNPKDISFIANKNKIIVWFINKYESQDDFTKIDLNYIEVTKSGNHIDVVSLHSLFYDKQKELFHVFLFKYITTHSNI